MESVKSLLSSHVAGFPRGTIFFADDLDRLGFPPESVRLALAELAECRIRRCPNHELYLMMIASAPGLTVARCNEILRQEKLLPLHNGAPDE